MTLTQITEKGIKDGEIINADINASAAIESSKLAKPLDFADNEKARLGDSQDLQIYHDGTDSIIDNNTGNLNLVCDSTQAINLRHGSENMLRAITDGAVELYFDNSKKLETYSHGIRANQNVHIQGSAYLDDANINNSTGILYFGDSQDLQIYHDGSHSYIDNSTGSLFVRGDTIKLRGKSADEDLIEAFVNGSVRLYYDNVQKFETQANGVTITGNCDINGGALYLEDNQHAYFGYGNDLQIFHDGSNSYIHDDGAGQLIVRSDGFQVRNSASTEYHIACNANGSVELYHDNSKKFETASFGVDVIGTLGADKVKVGDNDKLVAGAGDDLQIYHDGSTASVIDAKAGDYLYIYSDNLRLNSKTGTEKYITGTVNGAVELYYDGSKKFETTSGGNTFHGYLFGTDNATIYLGASNDLQIYHNGSHSYVSDEGTGGLVITTNGPGIYLQKGNSESFAKFLVDGAVELNYDDVKKFETTTSGISLSGDVRFNNSTWTGESSTGKIQTHSGHMYLQNASNSGFWVFRLPNGTETANINSSGTYSSSDERRKKDITTITSAVDTIKKLTGRSFTWKEDNKKSFGVIAQEVETVLPDLITTQTVLPNETNSDPYKMVNYSALTGYFIEAVKELSTEVETLKAKVAALEA